MQKKWRKLDNSAKIFSFAEKTNSHVFRLSAILTEIIDPNILKMSIVETLKNIPSFKVKKKTGLFWEYLEENKKEPIVEVEHETPCNSINLRRNNDYLFKVTYYENKINLDVFHILTDGVGATILLKEILYNYLNIKYKLVGNHQLKRQEKPFYRDAYLDFADKTLKCEKASNKDFAVSGKVDYLSNKTYHYIIKLDEIKSICKKRGVTISEYLSAVYIYAIYNSIYVKSSNKDISLCVPINLRKYYNVEATSNFFTYTNIKGNVTGSIVTFDSILDSVHKESKEKIVTDKIKTYLARDVKLGMNLAIRLIPLFIKKIFMKCFGELVSKSSTSLFSNIGAIEVEEQYKKYIDNILFLVMPGIDKIKCTVCSFDNNLTLTLNTNLLDDRLEKEIYTLFKQMVSTVKVESNMKVR